MLEKERSLQEQVDELRTNLASLEQSRTIKEKTASDSRKKISEIGRELATIGSGGAALHSAEQELHSAVSVVVCVASYPDSLSPSLFVPQAKTSIASTMAHMHNG